MNFLNEIEHGRIHTSILQIPILENKKSENYMKKSKILSDNPVSKVMEKEDKILKGLYLSNKEKCLFEYQSYCCHLQ